MHWGATTQDVVDTALVLRPRGALGPIRRGPRPSARGAAALALRHASAADGGADARPARRSDHVRAEGRHLGRRARRVRSSGSTAPASAARPRSSRAPPARWRRSAREASRRAGGVLPAARAGAAPTFTGTRPATVCATSARRSPRCLRGRADRRRGRPAPGDRGRRGRRAFDRRARRLLHDAAEAQSDDVRVRGRERPSAACPDRCAGGRRRPRLRARHGVVGGRVDRAPAGADPRRRDRRQARRGARRPRRRRRADACEPRPDRRADHGRGGDDGARRRDRPRASHAAVLAASRRALAVGRSLLEELADDPVVSEHVDRAELERIMDPGSYLGLSADSAESVARRILGEP